MREHDIDLIVKGYRNDEDLKWENYQAEWNYTHGGYETRLIKCENSMEGISSTLARQLIDSGSSTEGVLTKEVQDFLAETAKKYNEVSKEH